MMITDYFKASRQTSTHYRIHLRGSVCLRKISRMLKKNSDVTVIKTDSLINEYFFENPFGWARIDVSTSGIVIKVHSGSTLEFRNLLIRLISEFLEISSLSISITNVVVSYEGCTDITLKQLSTELQKAYNSFITLYDSLNIERLSISSINDERFLYLKKGINVRWASIELLLLFLKGKDIPETYIQSIQLIINRGRKTYGAIKQPSPEWSEQMVDDLCQQAIIEIDQAIYEVLIIVRKLEREVNLSELDLDEPLQLINGFYDTGDMLLGIDETVKGMNCEEME